ncbi:hypothetical protein ISN45_At01g071520 [Arabidopsis thaliana x Arabidopsis arenosa]|uniref:Epidermal patterning factor-like protein n=1 Tax=Arabidopsis thaliana x Arabidopsis arenosa TaxID=1240361 RepID=A0A8T2GYA7_9BRAS|nr:hypothetical protein ISN45_At01g071520 [Arabidopsis thaliana x Arabidopsis arenosa]
MDSSRNYKRCSFGAALFVVNIVFSLLSLHYNIAGAHGHQQRMKESVLGSEPPVCATKCLNCKPCLPYLFDIRGAHDDDDDSEPYYPVKWICRCRDRVFEP